MTQQESNPRVEMKIAFSALGRDSDDAISDCPADFNDETVWYLLNLEVTLDVTTADPVEALYDAIGYRSVDFDFDFDFDDDLMPLLQGLWFEAVRRWEHGCVT